MPEDTKQRIWTQVQIYIGVKSYGTYLNDSRVRLRRRQEFDYSGFVPYFQDGWVASSPL
mgnify:CR=1 FL=1